jgi:hypothetical protein
MLRFNVSPSLRQLAVFAAVCVAGGAYAQSPAAGSAAPAPPAASALGTPTSKADTEMLAKASQLYYSTAKTGLKSFDCAVHPEWRTLILSAQPGTAVADDDPRILMLKTASITLHGRLSGGSTLGWAAPSDPAKPADKDATETLDQMHKATERTLTGFMQFWSPFVDGSVIPTSADGLEITHTDKGHTLHADQGGTSLTEVLGNDLIMQQFNVVMGGAKINFSPRYKPTDQGLLVNGFLAHIQAPGMDADKAEEMHVEIDYQTLSGFPIPSRINMEVLGQGKFNFVLDGCTVNSN